MGRIFYHQYLIPLVNPGEVGPIFIRIKNISVLIRFDKVDGVSKSSSRDLESREYDQKWN